jgi:glucose 1-dehydrogenase
LKLANKVAVITGAARGIGRACAERLLADGCRVVIADIDTTTLATTLDETEEDFQRGDPGAG